MKVKKLLALGLAVTMITAIGSGCSQNKENDGETTVTIGYWPDDTWPQAYREQLEGYKAAIEEAHPGVTIKTDTTNTSDTKIFYARAAANNLPTIWRSHFTEIQKTVNSGYARPITDILKKHGYIDAMNPEILDLVKGEDGEIYAIPVEAATMALTINKALFVEAGLVNEDGTIKVPDTYEQMVEYAGIISEKTGKAGYGMITSGNGGGWQFMNIAWSNGVEFMKQQEDGSWKATFNTQEMIDSFQQIYDMKWKYNATTADSFVDRNRLFELYGAGEVGMFIMNPMSYTGHGLDLKNHYFAKLPKGPAGRFVEMSGGVYMFDKNATDEQVEICIEFLKMMGHNVTISEEEIESIKASAAVAVEKNDIILPGNAVPIWSKSEREQKVLEARAEFVNISEEQCGSYFDFSDCTLHVEEPVACQELYSILTSCLQEIVTNKDVDIKALVENACNDFQNNHLGKL